MRAVSQVGRSGRAQGEGLRRNVWVRCAPCVARVVGPSACLAVRCSWRRATIRITLTRRKPASRKPVRATLCVRRAWCACACERARALDAGAESALPWHLLRDGALAAAPSAEAWLALRAQFARSLAVYNVANWVRESVCRCERARFGQPQQCGARRFSASAIGTRRICCFASATAPSCQSISDSELARVVARASQPRSRSRCAARSALRRSTCRCRS